MGSEMQEMQFLRLNCNNGLCTRMKRWYTL
jgi:hypothetical protein